MRKFLYFFNSEKRNKPQKNPIILFKLFLANQNPMWTNKLVFLYFSLGVIVSLPVLVVSGHLVK